MRRIGPFLASLILLLSTFLPSVARAGEIEIHLLIMGPGDHLYTRGGHAALLVAEMEQGELVRSDVYNYGDTDWDDPLLVPHFLRGDLTFFLSDTGDLVKTLEDYGVRQGREVTRQKLNVTPAQAAEIKRRLEMGVAPGKREYTFHHIHALCSTRIVDLLDDVLGGPIRAALANEPGPDSPRHYHQLIFSESLLASIGGDLFMGRLHDRGMSKLESLASPEHVRDYLQQVLVPVAPGAADKVPLAGPPVLIVARHTPLVLHESQITHVLWGSLIALLLGLGAMAYRRAPSEPERAAKLAFWTTLVSGVLGALLLGFLTLSRVPEFRQNELILVFWPADLWLALRMRAFLKSRAPLGAWAARYAHVRLAVAALVVLGHATGLLHQEPRIVAALGVTEAAVLWVLVRALAAHREKVSRRTPALRATPGWAPPARLADPR